MVLADKAIRVANHGEKISRLFDGGGLYRELAPNGGKCWRLKYRFAGKEERLFLGDDPHVTLKDAGDRRDEAKKLVANGIDPAEQRKAQNAAHIERAGNSFEAIAREWYANCSKTWVKGHADKIIKRLKNNVFPYIGSRPVAEIFSRDTLAMLKRVEQRGVIETARRTKQVSARCSGTQWPPAGPSSVIPRSNYAARLPRSRSATILPFSIRRP